MVYILHDDKTEIIDGQEFKFNMFLELLFAIVEEFKIDTKNDILIVHHIAFYSHSNCVFKTTENSNGIPTCTFDYLIKFLIQDCHWRDLVTNLFEFKGMQFGLFEYDYPFIQHTDQKLLEKIVGKFEKPQILPEITYHYSNITKNQVILK
jgi:hypothetical protein